MRERTRRLVRQHRAYFCRLLERCSREFPATMWIVRLVIRRAIDTRQSLQFSPTNLNMKAGAAHQSWCSRAWCQSGKLPVSACKSLLLVLNQRGSEIHSHWMASRRHARKGFGPRCTQARDTSTELLYHFRLGIVLLWRPSTYQGSGGSCCSQKSIRAMRRASQLVPRWLWLRSCDLICRSLWTRCRSCRCQVSLLRQDQLDYSFLL